MEHFHPVRLFFFGKVVILYVSRARTIKLANWDINPEQHEPVQLEKIPCLDELENNELLIENIPDF